MQAVVGHHHWGRPGGGQLVVAAAAHALSKQREVTLAGIGKFDLAKYQDWFGINLANFKVKTLPIALSAFGLYSRLLIWYPTERAIKRDTDVVFLDEYNYRPMLRMKSHSRFRLIEYIHFPIEKSVGLDRESDPYVTERYGHFPLNLYWEIYLKLLKFVVRKNPFESADMVLTNSKWTGRVIKETYGESPIVLNPPVPPNVEPDHEIPSFENRDNNVVMVGRFTEEKHYQWIISNVVPKLKGSTKFFLFGGAGTPVSIHYKNRLISLASRAGLKVSDTVESPGDVHIVSDAPRHTINRAIDRSKLFLHATINEHWGIVVAEAMARGVPILVHKSGGAWTDLAQEGSNGLGYQTAEEAIEFVNTLFTDQRKWNHFQKEGLLRTRELSLDNFSRRLNEIAGSD
jgi:alpha-1,2-mannosyltransferase